MEEKKISSAVIRRLPRYYRYLGELIESGVQRISSKELSARMKVTASQIRQDLNNFGGFGQQGYGYNVQYLYEEIGKILGIDRNHNMVIIGAGNLGKAIVNYSDFEKRGFVIKGIFDNNPKIKGTKIRGIEVRMMNELTDFIKNNDIEIVALTIPKEAVIGFVVCLFFFVFVVFKSIGWTSPGGSSEPPGFFCARFRRQPDLRTQE